MKSVILCGALLKTLDPTAIAGMLLLCRLATKSCCWKLIAQWIIRQLHNVTLDIHHFFPLLSIFLSPFPLSASISSLQSPWWCLFCGVDCVNWGQSWLQRWTVAHTRRAWGSVDGRGRAVGQLQVGSTHFLSTIMIKYQGSLYNHEKSIRLALSALARGRLQTRQHLSASAWIAKSVWANALWLVYDFCSAILDMQIHNIFPPTPGR